MFNPAQGEAAALRHLSNPNLDPADLAIIAGAFARLAPHVAVHPALYEDLRQWLAALARPDVDAALAAPRRAAAPPARAPQAPPHGGAPSHPGQPLATAHSREPRAPGSARKHRILRLVELLVLILVLALAASIAIPLFWQDRKALAAAVQGDLASLANDLLISYWSDHSDPPTTVKVKTDGPDGRPYVAIEADGDTYNSITLSHALNPDTLRLDFGADYRDWCASAAPKGSDQRWHVVPPPNAKKGHIYSVRPEDVEPGDCG